MAFGNGTNWNGNLASKVLMDSEIVSSDGAVGFLH